MLLIILQTLSISSIVKSAGANIFATRDKYDECAIRKNITYPTLGKCRWTGNTGRIEDWYYDLESHTMYDFKTYARDNPDKLPEDFDFDYDPFDRSPKTQTKAWHKDESSTFKMEVQELVVPQKL